VTQAYARIRGRGNEARCTNDDLTARGLAFFAWQNARANQLWLEGQSTTGPSGWTRRSPHASNIAMANDGSRRWDVARRSGPPAVRSRPTRWRTRDLQGPLPRATVRVAIRSLPTRAPWPEVDEDGWWREVLADRRLRRSAAKPLSDKDEDAGQRLDRLPVKSLTFSCEWCGQRARLKIAELIAMFGRERNVRSIGRQVLKCRDRRSLREGDECPITYQA
jgi:hypothetical protein